MQKSCRQCSQQFVITEEDQKFIEKISPVLGGNKFVIPAPTLCSSCRHQRRISFRNERKLYNRKCDLCGKPMITIYSPDKNFKIYCSQCWWSDKWDAVEYSREYDFTKPFFTQFKELQKDVPRLGMLFINNENSEYTNYVSNLKNCYLLFSGDYDQDCMYGTWIENSIDCMDDYNVDHCQLSYECFFSNKLYNCIYVINSSGCHDSAFLYDCKGCNNCYMCNNLRNKEFCIENKQYSKEEYVSRLEKLDFGSYETLQREKQKFFNLIKQWPHRSLQIYGGTENSTGNFLTDCSNCINCYEVLRGKDSKNIQSAFDINNVMDCSYVDGSWGYENCETVPMPANSAFNLNSYTGSNMFYTDTCMNNCHNLFGCISLKHKENCILNKQYSKEDYESLVGKIIEQMQKNGEWGEFFPMNLSPFGYNETIAQEHYTLNKEEVEKAGLKWMDEQIKGQYQGQKSELPDNINNTDEDVLKQILSCEKCGKNYKIIAKELDFYKKMKLPIPRFCPDCRHLERLQFRNPTVLYNRKCVSCSREIETTFSPDRPETVYCQECYLKEVI